jgi:hypothetical protein
MDSELPWILQQAIIEICRKFFRHSGAHSNFQRSAGERVRAAEYFNQKGFLLMRSSIIP